MEDQEESFVNLRVKEKLHYEIKQIAAKRRMKLHEIADQAWDCYQRQISAPALASDAQKEGKPLFRSEDEARAVNALLHALREQPNAVETRMVLLALNEFQR